MDESFSQTIFLYGVALVLAVGKAFMATSRQPMFCRRSGACKTLTLSERSVRPVAALDLFTRACRQSSRWRLVLRLLAISLAATAIQARVRTAAGVPATARKYASSM